MANFIPTTNNSYLQALGSAVGQGLATEHYSTKDILDRLAQQKAQSIHAKNLGQFMPGATQEQLQALASFPQEWQRAALLGGFGAAPQSQPQPAQPMQSPVPQALMQQQNKTNPFNQFQQALQQQQPQRQPSIAELELLRRLPPAVRKQMGFEPQPEPMLASPIKQPVMPQAVAHMPNAQPIQQPVAPNVGQGQQPISLGESIRKGLGGGKEENVQQARVVKQNAPYVKELSARSQSARGILSKATELLQLIEDPNSEVASGVFGYVPTVLQNAESQRAGQLADDIAAEMTALQSGVQSISKIRFNQQRKPNLTLSRQAQIERTEDLLKDASKVLLEQSINDYLITSNGDQEPPQLRTKVHRIYNKLEKNIPDVPQGAQDGQSFLDPKTGARWTVQGPIMVFEGLQ